MAGIVEISNQIQPHIHKMNANNDLAGDSHSKQLLCERYMLKYITTFAYLVILNCIKRPHSNK